MRDIAALTPDTQAAYLLLREFSNREQVLPGFIIAETLRTCDRQNELFAQGPSVTRAQGCMSWHVMGRAFDIHAEGMTCENIRPLGRFWESLGGIWGGRWGDCVHFEWHPGKKMEEVCYAPASCGFHKMPLSYPRLASGSPIKTALGVAAGVALTWYVWQNRAVLLPRR
jgi:hypothetical protein